MNNLIFETACITDFSNENCQIDAHVRTALKLKNIFKSDIVSSASSIDENVLNKKYDNIFIVYASFYMNIKLFRYIATKNINATYWWVTNEYNLNLNSIVINFLVQNNKKLHVVSNYAEQAFKYKNEYKYYFVNLNSLIYEYASTYTLKKYECIYYGTYREGRETYYKKYLQNNIFLSTSKKNFSKYKKINCNCKYIDKLQWLYNNETLRLFKYSIYFEDEFTHANYNNLANRFYECVMCNVVLFFDVNCINTLKISKLSVPDIFIVSSYEDIMKIISENSYEQLINLQKHFKQFCIDSKIETIKQLKNIL